MSVSLHIHISAIVRQLAKAPVGRVVVVIRVTKAGCFLGQILQSVLCIMLQYKGTHFKSVSVVVSTAFPAL